MAEAGALYRVKGIDQVMGRYGYAGRLLGSSVYICEPVRTAEVQGCIAVAVKGMQPVRTLDPGECAWDVLANRIVVSPEFMLAKMMAAAKRNDADLAYAAEQASAEMKEAAVHMDDKLHFAVGGSA